MNLRLTSSVISIAALVAVTVRSEDARACGGCFHEPGQVESTVVTGHRMAFSISPERTILWDQIEYSGSPSAFAWVLPIKPGAEIQIASDAWFEVLEAATAAKVVSPPVDCFTGGFSDSGGCSLGCGADEAAGSGANGVPGKTPPVTVVHQGTVGPYETVTLHANVPGALPSWLTSNGFAIDASVQPVIDAYTSEGFDFIALRLIPGQGVQQMKPVRVVTPGMSPTLPLRMVAAGTGAKVGITLFIVGEGRWEADNFPNGRVDAADLVWDPKTDSSNYATVRNDLLAGGEGRTWATVFSKAGSLFGQLMRPNEWGSAPVTYPVGASSATTIADAVLLQGQANGEATDAACSAAFAGFGQSMAMVSGACLGSGSSGSGGGGAGGSGSGGGGAGGSGSGGAGGGGAPGPCAVPPGMIDARVFSCGALDDIAAATVGLHPAMISITRLEANLPRAALADDLEISASLQDEVDNYLLVTRNSSDPCAAAGLALIGPAAKEAADFRRKNKIALASSLLLIVAAAFGRRSKRALRREMAG